MSCTMIVSALSSVATFFVAPISGAVTHCVLVCTFLANGQGAGLLFHCLLLSTLRDERGRLCVVSRHGDTGYTCARSLYVSSRLSCSDLFS